MVSPETVEAAWLLAGLKWNTRTAELPLTESPEAALMLAETGTLPESSPGDRADTPDENEAQRTGTLTSNPTLIASCDLGIPYYSVLASYNPADHKIYYAYMPGNSTSIYAADYNFGGSMSCPSLSAPTYQYNYALNQLCFDNNGNNYIFFNFDVSAGTAHLAQANLATGEQVA